jgi:hypothetical protein
MKAQDRQRLLATLEQRFATHPHRHRSLVWARVRERLDGNAAALASLLELESTGGEPDVVAHDDVATDGSITFVDCAAESPTGRRSLCYDRAARETRKENAPAGSVCEMAAAMGVELLSEDAYRALQSLGEFDLKTSSWVLTPPDVRTLGGALFCDRRYGKVFTYHNGVQSYYAARGFRALLRI